MAMKVARTGAAATAANDHGAINIWRDRKHRLHAVFCRHLVYLNHTELATLADLELWLKKWWPALTDGTIA